MYLLKFFICEYIEYLYTIVLSSNVITFGYKRLLLVTLSTTTTTYTAIVSIEYGSFQLPFLYSFVFIHISDCVRKVL